MSRAPGAQDTNERRIARLWLGVFVLLMLPFCLLGYGPDNDTYGVLDCGRAVWLHHVLQTSRPPGYWTYEALIFALDRAGRFVATNIASLAVSAVVLWRFYVIASRLGVRFRILVTACLAVVPVYVVASTTTIDYIWSMLGLLLMAEALAADRWGLAIVAGTFGYLIRGANCAIIAGMVAGAMLYEFWNCGRLTRRAVIILLSGMVIAFLGSLQYIASYRAAGNSMIFLQGMVGDAAMWTPKMRIGRFLYKTILLFSLPGWLVLIWSYLASAFASADETLEAKLVLPAVAAYRGRMLPMLLGGVLANTVLFFKFSIEISYLLPGTAFLLLLLGVTTLAKSRAFPLALLATVVLANLVTLRLAEPNVPGRSTDARFHLGLEQGELLEATGDRWKLRHCRTNDCWNTVMHPGDAVGLQPTP